MPSIRCLLSLAGLALVAATGSAQAATITEFPLPVGGRAPVGIAAAPGGLWFGEHNSTSIGRSTLGGSITEFWGLSGPASSATVAPGGDIWMTEPTVGKIADIRDDRSFSQYSVGSQPISIAAGPDGNLWFTQQSPSRIGRITPKGVVLNEFNATGKPGSITAGPDGNLWFTESGAIGRITTGGQITQYAAGLSPSSITAGPDGNLWFTKSGAIGRITPGGQITQFTTGLTANSDPSSITAAPDGNLWFTESANPGRIGRITPTGTITEFTTGLTANSDPTSITAAPDGNLWFTESASPGRIGRVIPDPAPTATTAAATGVQQTAAILVGASDPRGSATTYHFDWGVTTAYGQRAPAGEASVGSDSAAHALSQPLSGLRPATAYHYRLVASSAAGTTYGADMNFVTPAQPSSLAGPLGPASKLAPPTLGRTAIAGVVSGTVLVRRPGTSVLVRLSASQVIPMGSLVNAAHGVVKVTNAIDRKGRTQSATLWAGSFVLTQARSGRHVTTFKLTGAPRCPASHRGQANAVRTAAVSKKAPVRLWGKDHHGRYSTRGRNSVATVRGTVWETVESCAGTRTVVKQGLVSVRDLHRHRSVLVKAGHSYLARP